MAFEVHMYSGTAAGMGCRKLRQREETTMSLNLLMKLWKEEEGQDLVEYALLVVLIALAATLGMKGLANAINATFLAAGTNLTANT
jgi:pilus assembly protein Flp/PilA